MRVVISGDRGLSGSALSANLASDAQELSGRGRSPERATGLPAGVWAGGLDGHPAQGWAHLAYATNTTVNLAGASLSEVSRK